MRFAVVSMVALMAAGSASCGADADPSDTTVGIANPASVFCVAEGGTVEIVDEADGQVGYCNLPDGTRVEEWEYFRSQSPTATTAP
jgi:putative hemolysin